MTALRGVITSIVNGLVHVDLIGANPITMPIENVGTGFSVYDKVWVGTYKGKATMIRQFDTPDEVRPDPPCSDLSRELLSLEDEDIVVESRQFFSRLTAGSGEAEERLRSLLY